MKRILIIFCIFLSHITLAARQLDSAKMTVLGHKLVEYYEALKHESLDVQKKECDFLIESTSDSLIRQFVALNILDHYLDSKIMGAENVAVHIFDKWFAPGTVKMKKDADFIAAKVFADFNRRSLIGEPAPPLFLETIGGDRVELFGKADVSGVFRILYFYDTGCAKCKVESILLRNFLSSCDYPVELCAIYVGDNHKSWSMYVDNQLRLNGARHLWDPALTFDFQRKYGVMQTPRMFLIGPDGVILGRGLDVKALEKLLDGIFAERKLEYGGSESEALFDGIFSTSGGRPTTEDVKGIADYIHDRTLATGDTLMFRQMAGDYLYYLSSHAGEGFKEGLRHHISKNILSGSGVWKSQDDSLKILGFAGIMSDLLSKAAPGTAIPSVKVPGELYTWKGAKKVNVYLNRLEGNTNIILFHTDGCNVCAAQKKALLALLSRGRDRSLPENERRSARKTKVLMVNMDTVMASDSSLAAQLMDSFDLSSLPFILETGSDGIIARRYITF